MGKWVDVPGGMETLERSQTPSIFLTWSMTALGMFCVGAAKRAAGARARMRESVFVKIIVGDGMV